MKQALRHHLLQRLVLFCWCCPVTYLLCFALVETKIAQIGGGGGCGVGRNIEFLYAFVLQVCNELHRTGNSTALQKEKMQPSLFLWRNSVPPMFVSSWMFFIHIVPCCSNHWHQCCEKSLDMNSLNFFHGMKSQTPTDHSFNFLKSWRRVGKTLSATVYLNRTLAWGWDLYMNHFYFLLKNWFDISSRRLWFFADTKKLLSMAWHSMLARL